MDSVAFLQQEIRELSLQIAQLNDKLREMSWRLEKGYMLQTNNLKKPDDQSIMVIPTQETS